MAAILQFRLTQGGSRAGTNPNETSSPASSIGGRMSSVQLSGTALNNLFDNVSPVEAASGATEFRAIDIYNVGDAIATSIELWISSNSTHASTNVQLAIANAATENNHTLSSYLEKLTLNTDIPAAPACSFSNAGVGAKISMNDITNGYAARIWIKRICWENANNLANDMVTISIQYA